MATTDSPNDRWRAFKREALGVLAVAASLTAGLWVKRIIERLTSAKIIDENVLKHGLSPNLPATTPLTTPPPREPFPFRAGQQSSWLNSLHRQHRTGPGATWVDGVGQVRYRAMVKTSDGFTLYDHDETLNPYHVVPCPLMRADETCDNCEFFVDQGMWRDQPQCAAHVKLHDEPREGVSLNAVRDHIMACR